MDGYPGQYYGDDIDNAVEKALNPDTLPQEGSTKLLTSGGAYIGIEIANEEVIRRTAAAAEAAAESAAEAASDASFSALRAAEAAASAGGAAASSAEAAAAASSASGSANSAAEYAAMAQQVVDSNFVLVDEDDGNKKYMVSLFARDGYLGVGLTALPEES